MIKKILISAGVIVVIAGLTLGVLLVVKHQDSAHNKAPTPVSKKLVLDHSKDYGACTVVDETAIKSALGAGAANLQKPVDAGITSDRYFGDGVKNVTSDTQTCVYPFAPGASSDQKLVGANGLTIKVTKYTNPEGPKAVIEQSKKDPTAVIVPSLGDAAFYTTNTSIEGPDAAASFTLLVFKNNESTSYAIIQPAKQATFTVESAKTALLTLAK